MFSRVQPNLSQKISQQLRDFKSKLENKQFAEIYSGRYAHFDWYYPNFALNSNAVGFGSNALYYDRNIAEELLLDREYRKNFIETTTEYFRQVNLYPDDSNGAEYQKIKNYLIRLTKIIQGYRILMTLCQSYPDNRDISEFEKRLTEIYQTVYKKSRQDPSQYRSINVNSGQATPKSIEQCFESDIDAMVFYDSEIIKKMKARDLAKLVFPEDKSRLKYFQIEQAVNNNHSQEIGFFCTQKLQNDPSPSPSDPLLRYFVNFANPQQGFFKDYIDKNRHQEVRAMNCSVTKNYLYSHNANKNLINETLANILLHAMYENGLDKREVKLAVELARFYGGLRNLNKKDNDFKQKLDQYLTDRHFDPQIIIGKIQRFSAFFQKLSEEAGIYSGRFNNAKQVGLRLAFVNDEALNIFNAKDSTKHYCKEHASKKLFIQIGKKRRLTGIER